MARYIIRLDDASDYMDVERWLRMERLLDQYHIKPLVGVIPCNKDRSLVDVYQHNPNFWSMVRGWREKGWSLAMHGYEHRYVTDQGGINPVNQKSEFAGLPYEEQARKITDGVRILNEHGVQPEIFFAPSHTFDEETVRAILNCSKIRIISDTVANKPYRGYGVTFVPQQSGSVRKLPFHTTTFCYHPNVMDDQAFQKLESFLQKYQDQFIEFPAKQVSREKSIYDRMLSMLYFLRR